MVQRDVVPSMRNDRSGSMSINEGIGTDREDVFSFALADSEFNFRSKHSKAEQGLCLASIMSPADELFHDGKIRPLQPFAQVQAISFFDEQPVKARLEILEDYGFASRRSEKTCSNHSGAAKNPLPSTLKVEIKQSPVRAKYESPRQYQHLPVARESQHQGKERGKQKATPETNSSTILRRFVAPQPISSVFYRRSQSLSPAVRVFHRDDEASCSRERSKENCTYRKSVESEGHSAAQLHQQVSGCKSSRRTLKELLLRDNSRRQSTELLIAKPSQATDQRGSHVPSGGQGQYRNLTWPERSTKAWSSGSSPHERHYAAQRAEAESMRKKTALPYRQGILGCLGFRSKSVRSCRYS